MRNYFILDGVDSRDFGVYISGQGTFNSPEKDYTFYNVPGRDGALLSSENRFNNVTLKYDAFICRDFDNNIAAFRTFLLSLNGYKRLTDSYHPDEFRYAVFTGPLEAKVEKRNDAGSFTITFSCKPQRYLLTGEAESVIGQGGTETVRGNNMMLVGSVVDTSTANYYVMYTPQSGTPDDPAEMGTATLAFFEILRWYGPPMNIWNPYSGYASDIEVTLPQNSSLDEDCVLAGDLDLTTGTGTASIVKCSLPTAGWFSDLSDGANVFRLSASSIDLSSIVACTHYKYWDASSGIAPFADQTIWVANGYIKIRDKRYINPAILETYLSQHNVCVAGEPSATVSLSVDVYTPNFPAGDMWVRSYNNAEVEFGYTPSGDFYNPTYMKSKPLITATVNSSTGGSFTINSDTVTISTGVSEVVIDCEMQDCYYGTTNLNSKVSFAPTYDFPVLLPGNNSISITANVSQLVIKPRWWRL